MLKKTLPLSFVILMALSALSACDKKEAPVSEPVKENTSSTQIHNDHDGHGHDHDHDHHDHAGHNHSHAPSGSITYSCTNGSSIQVAIVEHEGESEAQLTHDGVIYDMSEDVQSKGRYTAEDSISGEDKGMALTINDTTAKLTSLDDRELLSCTKN